MILIDANLLIYSTTACPHYEQARQWLDGELTGGQRVGMPWQSLTAFLRVVTNTRIYGPGATSVDEAWTQVETWLGCPNVWIPGPTERHASTLKLMLQCAGRGANLIPDAHLAAIAIEHGLTLCTADTGFARFSGLRWMNPLAETRA